jgi:hypothetical protein
MRWWTFGEAATMLFHTLPMQITLAQNFDKMAKNGKARETSQMFHSLAKEPEIVCDLALAKSYH